MYSETPDIIPFTSPFRRDLLAPEQIAALQRGTLRLLEEVGVHFPSRRALEIFADSGAHVDMAKEIVRIPPDLVRKVLATAPRAFVLGGREPRFDLMLDGSCSYLCTDGCGVHVIDFETRQKRPSRKADIDRMARVCDALPLVSFFWPMVSAQDCGKAAPVGECHAGLTNTLKHVRGGTTVFPPLASYIVEMATVVAGSEEERRRRPPICANICTIAPLGQDRHGIESALIYAGAGIPVSFMAMPTMGSTAPATPLGAIVQGDAEAISGLVLLQLAYPGAPAFHSNFVSLMDPHTGAYLDDVPLPVRIIAVQMAHAWGVPSLGGSGVSTDAPDIGYEVGREAGQGAAALAIDGGEICGYMGLTGGSMTLYPEKIILDHEALMDARDLMGGFDFDEADMALDVIAAVGPRSHYLKQRHTRDHIRDFRLSRIRRQKGPDGQEHGSREAALALFKEIDATHHPEPLPEATQREMDRILSAAQREAERL
jgi:trimethylamine--corrinoid protein Co-methyltransferase